MDYEQLTAFLRHNMRMSHVYQPVMIRTLLASGGRCTIETIARELLIEDRSQIEYYEAIVKNMVGRVLANRAVVKRQGSEFQLLDAQSFSQDQVTALQALCDSKIAEFIEKRGDAIWAHRSRSLSDISGTTRYEVLKAAKFHCELCGVSAEERALEVDHIVPRSHGGTDEQSNLQALCYSCNSMKRDRDDTDFRAVRAAYEHREPGCSFCDLSSREVVLENSLAAVLRDAYPVTHHHLLVIPKRHVPDYFDLGTAESRACENLIRLARKLVSEWDPSIRGANIGVNIGVSAGQTMMHCHVHLIPRRDGDVERPRGGVRCVVPGTADYIKA